MPKNTILSSASDNPLIYPRVAVGAVVKHNGSFLLVKRANSPSRGRWSIPGGKIILGETLQQAAQREVLEETGVVIRALEPVFTFDLIEKNHDGSIRFHYVIVDLKARYVSGEPSPGGDALGAVWVPENSLDVFDLSPETLKLFARDDL